MKVIKLLIAIGLCLLMLFSSATFYAKEPINVILNGKNVVFDQPLVIEENRILVPARAILEALNMELKFDAKTRTVTAKSDDIMIIMTLDSNKVLINADEKTIDPSAKIINGRTMIPIRFIAETMNLTVDWDDGKKLITLTDKPKTQTEVFEKVEEIPTFKKEAFSEKYYANFSNILNLTDFIKIENEKVSVLQDDEKILRYQIRDTDIDEKDIERYVDSLVDIGFERLIEKNVYETVTVTTLSKDNNIVQIEMGANELYVKITVYNSQYYKIGDTRQIRINSKNTGYYEMTETDIMLAIKDGENESKAREIARRKNEYYDYDASGIKYKLSTTSPSLSKKNIDIFIETPYNAISTQSWIRSDKMYPIFRKYNNTIQEEAKEVYEVKHDYGNKVYISLFFSNDIAECIKENKIVLRQNNSNIIYEEIKTEHNFLDIGIDLRTIDTSLKFELIVPTLNNSLLIYEVDLSQYK